MSKSFWNKFRPLGFPFLILASGVLLRLYLATWTSHNYDMATFTYWAKYMSIYSPALFYDKVWTDYLPLPLFGLAQIYKFSQSWGLSYEYLQKFIISSADVIAALGIFLIFHKKLGTQAKLIALLVTVSPILLMNAAVWGQVDNIPALLSLLALLLFFFPRLIYASGILFGLAVGIKPIVVLIAPLLAFLAFRQKKLLIFSLAASLTFLIPGIFPVLGDINNPLDLVSKPVSFLWGQTTYQSSVYPYTTVNAFNFWGIYTRHWISDVRPVLGVTARALGYLLFGLFLVLPLRFSFSRRKKLDIYDIAKLSSVVLLSFAILTTRMHERHLLFGIPFLIIASVKDISLLGFYLLFSTTYLLNLYAALFWVLNNQTFPFSDVFITIIGVVNVLGLIALILTYVPHNFWSRLKSTLLSHKPILLLVIVALLMRLIALNYPSQMIFDEVYHAFTAREMIHNNPAAWEWWNTPPRGFAYEWTHPPLAKYGMVLGMLLFGQNSFGWRFFSAILGAATVYLLYRLVINWWTKEKTALIAAFLLTFSGLHLVQSRIAMNDIYMLFFLLFSLLLASGKSWKASAIAFGFALSSKWSAIYGLVPISVMFWTSRKNINFTSLLNFLRLGLIVVFVYFLLYTPFFLSGHSFSQFIELHRQMWHYHTQLKATHSYQSQPWEWLLSIRPVWYFVEYKENSIANIYAQGNPFLLWSGLIALFWLAFSKLRGKVSSLLTLLSYAVFTLPWFFSPRIMFFYHYLPSIPFLCIALAVLLSQLSPLYRKLSLGLILVSFIILIPIYYGFPMSRSYWDILFAIFPSWK